LGIILHIGYVHWGLIAGAVRVYFDELNIQVRWSFALAGLGLVDDFHLIARNLTTPWEIVTGPIAEVPDRIVESWELDPVLDTLTADLPEGHPGRSILVFQEDFAQFQKSGLVCVWRWVVNSGV
jgi:hypothetical protein